MRSGEMPPRWSINSATVAQGETSCLVLTIGCSFPLSRKRRRPHYPAYFLRLLSRDGLESAVTSHALGQKHRSTHHHSCGTPALFNAGSSLSKSSLPVP